MLDFCLNKNANLLLEKKQKFSLCITYEVKIEKVSETHYRFYNGKKTRDGDYKGELYKTLDRVIKEMEKTEEQDF